MSDTQDDGGPAFACASPHFDSLGMSLRDYFAAAAMQGFVSSYTNGDSGDADAVAGDSYTLADAMLAARKEGA